MIMKIDKDQSYDRTGDGKNEKSTQGPEWTPLQESLQAASLIEIDERSAGSHDLWHVVFRRVADFVVKRGFEFVTRFNEPRISIRRRRGTRLLVSIGLRTTGQDTRDRATECERTEAA